MKAIVILTALALCLGGYTYYSEFYLKEKTQQAELSEKTVFKGIDQEQVESLTIQSKEEKLELKRGESGESRWNIVSPFKDAADLSEVEGYLSELLQAKVQMRVAIPEGANLSVFGRDQIKSKITITGGGQSKFIEISEKKNFESKPYIFIDGSDEAFLADGPWTEFDKRSSDFRDLRLYRGPSEGTEKISLSRKGSKDKLQFNKSDSGLWVPEFTPALPIDSTLVDRWVRDIQNIRAEKVLIEDVEPKALKSYGLHLPEVAIAFEGPQGFKWNGEFSKQNAESRFARSSDTMFLASVSDQSTLEALQVEEEDFWLKDAIFNFDGTGIDRIEVTYDKKKTSYQRTEEWKQDGDSYEASSSDKISGFIAKLQELRAEEYKSEPAKGFKLNMGKILLKRQSDAVFTLQWGEDTSDKQGPRFFVKTSVLDRPVQIARKDFDALEIETLFFKEKEKEKEEAKQE